MNIDSKSLIKLILEITDRHKKIADLFPKGNDDILKHLAASGIHLALFMKNFNEIMTNKKTELPEEAINKFLSECGCDFNGCKDKQIFIPENAASLILGNKKD